MNAFNKHIIQKNICYAELVYERIKKKLNDFFNKMTLKK